MSEIQPQVTGEILATILKQHIQSNRPDQVMQIVRNGKSINAILADPSHVITAIFEHMNSDVKMINVALYTACEELLKAIAVATAGSEIIIELLEVIDTAKEDNIVVSALKALQLSLLNQQEDQVRSLEWCLNSIQLYVDDLPLSATIRYKLDTEEERLLEEEIEVRRILSFYYYLFLFYEPILSYIIKQRNDNKDELQLKSSFIRNCGITRTNVLTCFIIQLFNEPFSALDFTRQTDMKNNRLPIKTNEYTRECVEKMVGHLTELIPDPYVLIHYAEDRNRWPYVLPAANTVGEDDPIPDIFRIEEKAPLIGLSVLFYALIGESYMPATVPQVYNQHYIFEMGLYMVTELLGSNEASLHNKGIRFATKLLKNLGDQKLSDETLDLDIHTTFLTNLVQMLNYTQVNRNSKGGIELLKMYIAKFGSIRAQHYHIRRLLQTVTNNKICGYLGTLYKDLVAREMAIANIAADHTMSPYCTGEELRQMMIEHICKLRGGVQADIVEQNDNIMAAVNCMIYFTISDRRNLTGFWDILSECEELFLTPLRRALEFTRFHYGTEKRRITNALNPSEENLEVRMLNSSDYLAMSKDDKLRVIKMAEAMFDVIEFQLSRLTECIETRQRATEQ